MKGLIFLWDLLVFFMYYKPKYDLEIDNAWKFTINKYNLEKFKPHEKKKRVASKNSIREYFTKTYRN